MTPDTLRAHRDAVLARLGGVSTLADLEALETEAMGGDSPLGLAKRGMRDLDEASRPAMGQAINEVQAALDEAFGRVRTRLEDAARDEQLEGEWLDMTLPPRTPARGSVHLVRQVWDEMIDVFVGLGYTVATGPEVDTDYHNFEALNYPDPHPARLETDTLYVAHGDDPEGVLLRTQTSTMQIRWMEEHPPPVYIVSPGRVYRRETTDATHTPVFHQMEGLAVDDSITMADLKGTLLHMAGAMFGKGRKVRFLPNFFPFTEPSAEIHVDCFMCDGSGCRVCGHSGWIELGGCGMVDPNVLSNVGYDPDALSGFAFGVGIDRIAMIRHAVPELRLFFNPDMRILEQYR
jgi:phenylalanyl-tRNA synthetase alpha chain